MRRSGASQTPSAHSPTASTGSISASAVTVWNTGMMTAAGPSWPPICARVTSRDGGMLAARSGATDSSKETAAEPISAIVSTAELDPRSVNALWNEVTAEVNRPLNAVLATTVDAVDSMAGCTAIRSGLASTTSVATSTPIASARALSWRISLMWEANR